MKVKKCNKIINLKGYLQKIISIFNNKSMLLGKNNISSKCSNS